MALLQDFAQLKQRTAQIKQDQQAQTAAVLAAKSGTGAAVGAGGPAASTVAQQAAQAQVGAAQVQAQGQAAGALSKLALAQQQLKDQAKLGQEQRLAQADLAGAAEAAKRTAAASGLAGAKTRQTKELNAAQERQTAEVTSRFEQALRQAASESKITRNDVFQHIKQSTAELASMKNAAHLQDLVQKQALANKKYTAALQSVGQINRLDDAQQFELEAQKQIFGAEMMNLFRQQSHLFDFNANERKFAESMNSLDLQTKMDLMVAASKTEAITAGVEGAAKIGATAYKDKWFSDSDKPSTIPSQIEYDTYLSGGETQSHATQQQLSGTPAWYSNKSSIYGD